GFNVVQLPTAPTPEQSAEAEHYGIWLLSQPDHPEALQRGTLGRPGDRVLAWQLKDDALEVDSNYAMRWAELVRERDAVFGRSVIVEPAANWAAVNKAADVLIARNRRIGMLSGSDYEAWLEDCPQKAEPGTPLWASFPTHIDVAVRQQV